MLLLWTLAIALGAWIGHANLWLHVPAASLLVPAGLAALALRAKSPGQAFRQGFLAATLAYSGCLYWIALPVHDYGNLPWLLAAPCPVLLAMYLALYAGLFCALLRRFCADYSPWLLAPAAGAMWAGLEYLRGWLFTGFPWLTTASAFSPWTAMIQAASVVGALGLGLLLATAAVWLLGPSRMTLRHRAAGVALLAALLGFGLHRLHTPLPSTAQGDGPVLVGLAQGSIDQSIKWDKAYQGGTVDRYLTLSGDLEKDGEKPLLVVWPETALPFYYQDPNELGRRVREFVRSSGTTVLTGSPAYTLDVRTNTYKLYNRAYLITGQALDEQYYDKQHLVPFGEYVPFGDWLPLGKLVESMGDFVPGTNVSPLRLGKVAAGMLICYEAIYSNLAQHRVSAGANILVNISNDAWFGISSAPLQHLDLSLLRAVEQGRSMVRSTNTGVSAFIDPYGRVLERTPLFHTAARARVLELRNETTVYHRFFRLVHVLIYAMALLPIAVGLAARRRLARD
ncbi:Apolipoprotein N-acyltransferase [Desulfovibrio sp. X2]|uniref:apolipoprotein N-acyltransferase n=1 Tax=Desulfovibrio sp. X2 TaxID=941449 RepID=UPI000358ACB5|nr:apolipoprotein N-acyltransferase [Desulfovibrio sp. X2]EPR42352.1 Apolipoprotein N-acyltransferase [Desulfovibrio sp. X2]